MTMATDYEALDMLEAAVPDGEGFAIGVSVEEQNDGRLDYEIDAMVLGDCCTTPRSRDRTPVNFQMSNTAMGLRQHSSVKEGLMLFSVGQLSGPTELVVDAIANQVFERLTDEIRALGWGSVIPAQSTFTRIVFDALNDAIRAKALA